MLTNVFQHAPSTEKCMYILFILLEYYVICFHFWAFNCPHPGHRDVFAPLNIFYSYVMYVRCVSNPTQPNCISVLHMVEVRPTKLPKYPATINVCFRRRFKLRADSESCDSHPTPRCLSAGRPAVRTGPARRLSNPYRSAGSSLASSTRVPDFPIIQLVRLQDSRHHLHPRRQAPQPICQQQRRTTTIH